MKINEGKLLLLLTGILSGIVISSFLIGSNQTTTQIITYSEFQNSSIKVNELRSEINELNKKKHELEKKLNQYDLNGVNSKEIYKMMENDYKDITAFYGSEKLKGPGLFITISDKEKPNLKSKNDLTSGITHNVDLYLLINELKNAGAKAVSINDNRVVSDSSITCEGLVIGINGELITPPYEIKAIGDPTALQYTLSQIESVFQTLKLRKLKTEIKKSNNIVIEGYRY